MPNLALKISILITGFVTDELCDLRESSQSLNFYKMLPYYAIGCLRNKRGNEGEIT